MSKEYLANNEIFVSIDQKEYPSLLREIQDSPSGLYVRGTLPKDEVIKIAVVGTRKATQTGLALAKNLAEELSRRGISIVSGLAMGIDAASHEGAIEGGAPTVAVLAGDTYSYPRSNEWLAKKILKNGGSIIAEQPKGVRIHPHHFLRRNRIVSGLCAATVIIEAPARSGSLATARLAAEQGREVMVFPGPASHPNFQGSHALIRDGARLVSSAKDILEDLGIENKMEAGEKYIKNAYNGKITDPNELRIIEAIGKAGAPLSVDKIVDAAKLEPHVVAAAATMLLIKKIIKETEQGYELS